MHYIVMTWHPFIVLYLIQHVPLNYFIKVILRKNSLICVHMNVNLSYCSHTMNQEEPKLQLILFLVHSWYWIWKVKSSLLHCGMQCSMQRMCICFYATNFGYPRIFKTKCTSHTVCTLHTEISIVQNSSLVNLYCVFHTTALFRMHQIVLRIKHDLINLM